MDFNLLFFVQTVNEFIEETIRRMLPGEFSERQKIYEEEMTELIGATKDGKNNIPGMIEQQASRKLEYLHETPNKDT